MFTRYNTEINKDINYKISIADFISWLKEHNMLSSFITELNNINSDNDIYYIAVDYSIPYIMIRYFINNSNILLNQQDITVLLYTTVQITVFMYTTIQMIVFMYTKVQRIVYIST